MNVRVASRIYLQYPVQGCWPEPNPAWLKERKISHRNGRNLTGMKFSLTQGILTPHGIHLGNIFFYLSKSLFQFHFLDDKLQNLFGDDQLILHYNKNFQNFQQSPTKHSAKSKEINQNWTRPENLRYLLFVNFSLLSPKIDLSRGDWTVSYILDQFWYFANIFWLHMS